MEIEKVIGKTALELVQNEKTIIKEITNEKLTELYIKISNYTN